MPAACTRFPSRTSNPPVRPSIGARMVVFSRLNLAVATMPESERTVASSAAAAARLAS